MIVVRMKSRKVIHNRDKCIGCNSCICIAPQTWEMDEKTGQSKLIGGIKKNGVYVGDILEPDVEANEQASLACPMNIIKVE